MMYIVTYQWYVDCLTVIKFRYECNLGCEDWEYTRIISDSLTGETNW